MAGFHPFRSLGREMRHVIKGTSIAHLDLRNRLLTAFTLTILVDIALTFVMYRLENGVKGSDISSLWDAFYFTTSQLTTIGTPMSNPITTQGQFVGLFMNIYAATIVSTIAGTFGAYFYHITDQRRKEKEAEEKAKSRQSDPRS